MPRLVRTALVAASCLFTAHGTLRAHAASSPPERVPSDAWCALSRSPILPPADAMPEALRCFYDEDDNGLDDDVERELARCFAPELRFDAGEPARAPNEPHALFNVRRPSSEPGRLRIAFTLLYARDAGFPEGLFCGGATRHPGDTEPLEVKLRLVQGYKGFYAHVEQLEIGAPGGPSSLGAFERSETSPTRPVVYVSRGKHHLYTRRYDGPYRGSPIGCRDIARGDGARIVPGSPSGDDGTAESFAEGPTPALDHVPVFDDRGVREGRGSAPLGPGRGRWWNACLARLHPDEPSKWRLATRSLRPNRFGLLPFDPFPGEEIQADRFGGGLGVADAIVTPIWRTLRLHEPMAEDAPTLEDATDYVAGGGAGFGGVGAPVWNAADDLSPPLLVPPWDRLGSRGGLLDRDGDGLVDLEDARPVTSSVAQLGAETDAARLAFADGALLAGPSHAPDVALTSDTVFVHDPRNGTAALVDLVRGLVVGWDPIASAWIRSAAPLDGIRGRRGSALTLVGPTLFVVGGERDGDLRGDAFAIDVFGRQTTRLGDRFPPRRGAQLTLADDGRGLVLHGGVDDEGKACGAVWVSDFVGPRAIATARRAFGPNGDELPRPERPVVGGWFTSGT